MKKNKLIYICVAALMLIGFTACEQAPMTYKVPTSITAVVDKTDYIKGEEFDPSTASVTVYFSDNSTEVLSGSQVAWTVDGGTDAKIDSASTVRFSYGSVNSTVIADVDIIGHEVVKVDLGNLPTTATWTGSGSTWTAAFATGAIDGITVNATLDNGATRELSAVAGEVKISVGDITAASSTKAENQAFKATVKVFDDVTGLSGDKVTYAGKDSYTVTVNAPTYEFKEDAAYTLKAKLTIGGKEYTSGTVYLKQAYSWELYLENTDTGATKTVNLSDTYVQDYQTYPSQTGNIGRESVSYTIQMKNGKGGTATVTIPAGTNYVDSVTCLGYADNFKPNAGTAITADNLKFDSKYAETFDDTKDTGIKWDATGHVTFLDSATPVAGKPFGPRIQISWTGLNGETKTAVYDIPDQTIPE